MDLTLEWKGRLTFEGAANSGFIQRMDSDESVGGNNNGARPMELIALGLAGCTAMDVISILRKKQQKVTDFKVKVHIDRADEHPKVFTKATIEYLVYGKDIDEAAVLRSIELSAEKYCPAQAMLNKAFPMELCYTIFDEKGNVKIEGQCYEKLAVA